MCSNTNISNTKTKSMLSSKDFMAVDRRQDIILAMAEAMEITFCKGIITIIMMAIIREAGVAVGVLTRIGNEGEDLTCGKTEL